MNPGGIEPEYDVYPESVLTSVDEENPWFQAMMKAARKQDLELVTRIFPASSDSSYLRNVGVPSYGFSPMPNTPVLLHDHDEFLNENVFLRGIEIFCDVISEMASVPQI